VVLGDAAYSDEAGFRARLSELDLIYAVGVRPGTTLSWSKHQPAPIPVKANRGRPRERLIRDADHQPILVLELARMLSPQSYRAISWRLGEAGELKSRFARVRIRAAQGDKPRAEEWLLIEWPKGEDEPTRYWFSTLPKDIPFEDLVATVKGRWMIERDYQNLKQEVGLGHFEGRSWGGFHHHASLCIAAYGFLMLERLRNPGKKTPLDSKNLPYPKISTRAADQPAQRTCLGQSRRYVMDWLTRLPERYCGAHVVVCVTQK
jgi:SRSO17 transposase